MSSRETPRFHELRSNKFVLWPVSCVLCACVCVTASMWKTQDKCRKQAGKVHGSWSRAIGFWNRFFVTLEMHIIECETQPDEFSNPIGQKGVRFLQPQLWGKFILKVPSLLYVIVSDSWVTADKINNKSVCCLSHVKKKRLL